MISGHGRFKNWVTLKASDNLESNEDRYKVVDRLEFGTAKVRYKNNSVQDREAAVERLREFLRFNYLTGSQAARQIGVRDTTLYAWLQNKSKPESDTAARITAFLDSLPAERGGIMPIGYEYREYKNWRGIPKPRRCPFCKEAKGEIRKAKRVYQGVCPNCGAMGPKREGYNPALLAWNGKD